MDKINQQQEKSESSSELKEGDEVQLVVMEKTKLGFTVQVNHDKEGLIYHNEIFELLQPGDEKRGYIKLIRPDGKIDVSLQPQGYDYINGIKYSILEKINANGGRLALGDKSNPEDIYRTLGISKKVFKKVVGALYKDKMILISDHEIKEADAE